MTFGGILVIWFQKNQGNEQFRSLCQMFAASGVIEMTFSIA